MQHLASYEAGFNYYFGRFSSTSTPVRQSHIDEFYADVVMPLENLVNTDPSGSVLQTFGFSRRFVDEFLFLMLLVAKQSQGQDPRCYDSFLLATAALDTYGSFQAFVGRREVWDSRAMKPVVATLRKRIHPTLLQSLVRGFVSLQFIIASGAPNQEVTDIPVYMVRFENVIRSEVSRGLALRFI